MKRALVFLFAVGVACAHGGQTAGEATQEVGPIVDDVRIVGTRALDAGDIASGLATQATGWLPWSEKHRLDSAQLDLDARRIITAAQLEGYFQAEVLQTEVDVVGEGHVRVVFHIREGPPTRVARFRVEGLDAFPPDVRATVTRELPVTVGAVFRNARLQAARDSVQLRLRQAGYARARATESADIYPERHEAEMRVEAQPGALFHYGDIEITGLLTVPEGKVRAIARRVLPQGAVFDPKQIGDARGQIFDMKVFQSVQVALAPGAEKDPERATVRIVVTEVPAHTLGVGGGVAIERNLQQVQATADYTNVNSLGGASRLSWQNIVGLTFLSGAYSSQNRAGISGQSTLDWSLPEVLPRTDLALGGSYERIFYQAYESNALRATLGSPIHLAHRVAVVPSLNFARYLNFSPVTPVGMVAPKLSPACPGSCQIAYPELALTWDARDDPLSPRRGFLLVGRIEYGAPWLDSTFNYVRAVPEARLYLPMSSSLVVASRLRFGIIGTLGATNAVPIVRRFFGGGSGDHRGFAAQQLSPFIEDTSGAVVPVGGEVQWLASLEARLRLAGSWGAAFFVDYGDVTNFPLSSSDGGRAAVGLGPRFYTAAGPVRLDIAWRPKQVPRRAVNTGTQVETSWISYFAVVIGLGEAF